MWKFSEKFMEDCICANPSAFLGESAKILSRQKRLGKFVPDLIARNDKDEILIVEIQQKALDRYHLYKSLEYRDLLLVEEKEATARVILFCETMDERYRQLLETHSIELIEMNRNTFISTAVKYTPSVISSHLASDVSEAKSENVIDREKIEFKPLHWGYRSSPSDVLSYLHREFGRLGIDIEKLPRKYYSQIYWDVCNFLDEEIKSALEKLWLPDAWNYDKLLVASSVYRGGATGKTLKRPRISISPYVTPKKNLSVVWWPTEFHRSASDRDWNWWPESRSVGWDRPENELFFVREVGHLNPSLHFDQWDDRVNYDVLDGIFIGLLKACLDHFVKLCQTFFDVELVQDIELDLSGPETIPENVLPDRWIVGWRIYNLEERERRNQDEWLGNFEKSYGFSIDKFSRCYRTAFFADRVGKGTANVNRKVVSELGKSGYKTSEGVVRSIADQINKHHDQSIRTMLK